MHEALRRTDSACFSFDRSGVPVLMVGSQWTAARHGRRAGVENGGKTGETMASISPAADLLSQLLGRAAEGCRRFGRVYLAVLFDPGRRIVSAASGSSWPFPLILIIGYGVLAAVLLRVAWPRIVDVLEVGEALADRRPNLPRVFSAVVLFPMALSVVALVGVRLFARQRAGLLTAMNCVAAALVPLSTLTAAAWMVLYLNAGLSLLVLIFGLLAALCFFAEALRSQYDLTTGCSLYAIPLMVVIALLTTGLFLLFLLALGGP